MSKTHFVHTSPAPGTQINPIHVYTDEQAAQIKALREVGQFYTFLAFILTFEFLLSMPEV